MALQRHPPIIALNVSPQWIFAHEVLENSGILWGTGLRGKAACSACAERSSRRIFNSSMADNEQLTHKETGECSAGNIRTGRLKVNANEADNQ